MRASFDMWQLGMLLYQLATQPWPFSTSYWDTIPDITDAKILAMLSAYAKTDTPAADPQRQLLPHERRPPAHGPLSDVICNLLAPSAEARWSSERLRTFLELNTTPLTQLGQATSTTGTAE